MRKDPHAKKSTHDTALAQLVREAQGTFRHLQRSSVPIQTHHPDDKNEIN